jgi:PAS domain S-box-containing protein
MNQYESRGGFRNRGDIYRKMVDEIQDYAIIFMDKDGIIQNWNKGAQKIKLYTEPEIIGRHFSIFYLEEDLAVNLPEKLLNEAKTKGQASQEGWRKRKDGSKFWGSITITAIHEDDGDVIGYTKVTRDLTERKIAEDTLRMSEERYHQMIAEVQDYAIILLDENGIIRNWNIGARKIKGYSAGEVIGKSFELFYTDHDRESGLPKRLLNEAKETGKAIQQGWRVRKDGSEFWGTIVITALHNKNGNVIGFSKVTRDLTQQKATEDKLLSYTRELEIQNSELEQFAYVASHDLQEPLRKIQTFAELIQQNLNDEEFAKKYFDKLNASAKRMGELVRSLLDYSRLSTYGNDEDRDEVDLNSIVNDMKDDFELLIQEKKATVSSGTLPTIKGNRIQLGQLFSNIVSNSLKFNDVNPVVTIRSEIVEKNDIVNVPGLTDDKYNHIIFEDNGIGFENEYNKVIFSLFQRLHGKQDYTGTGIGLALCKRIVDNHNGFITAVSNLGKGATFNVYLPV